MLSRRRLDHWGGAFLALLGLTACGGVSEEDDAPPADTAGTGGTSAGAGGTAGTGNGGTGGTDVAGTGGTAGSGNGGTGAIGRPFLVQGNARTASPLERSDWLAREVLSAAPRHDEHGALLAQHWQRAALMEHASVAAFARFSLELLALGAPPDLLLDCADAMKDETSHAELCFGLASRYGAKAVGPGPLSMESALGDVTLESAVRNALLEGCIGETLAAAEAQAACEHVTDPIVKNVLERIAADETRHAALAFRFVTWALGRGDARIADLVRRTLREHREAGVDGSVDTEGDAALLEAGVLPARHRADVRRYAYETIVLRALPALLRDERPSSFAPASPPITHLTAVREHRATRHSPAPLTRPS
jgi:hypothetical protein